MAEEKNINIPPAPTTRRGVFSFFLLRYSESLSGDGCNQMLNRKFVIKRALVRINKMRKAFFLGKQAVLTEI